MDLATTTSEKEMKIKTRQDKSNGIKICNEEHFGKNNLKTLINLITIYCKHSVFIIILI